MKEGKGVPESFYKLSYEKKGHLKVGLFREFVGDEIHEELYTQLYGCFRK